MKKIINYIAILTVILAFNYTAKADGYITIGYLTIHGDTLYCHGDSIHTTFILPVEWGCYGEKHGSDYKWFRNGDSLGEGFLLLFGIDSLVATDTGTYYCIFKIYDDMAFTTTTYTTTPISIHIDQNCYTGFQEIESSLNKISVAPNPFITQTTFKIQNPNNSQTIHICNLLGQELKIIPVLNNKEINVTNSQLPPGIYLYKLIENNSIILGIGKIVVE